MTDADAAGGHRYVKAADNETVTADQVSAAPAAVAATIQATVAEYETTALGSRWDC